MQPGEPSFDQGALTVGLLATIMSTVVSYASIVAVTLAPAWLPGGAG